LGIGDSEDSPSLAYEGNRFAHTDEERLCLRIERGLPLFESDVHRWIEERGCLRSRVADEGVELTEFSFNFRTSD